MSLGYKGHWEMVVELIENYGANFNGISKYDNKTLLHNYAVFGDNKEGLTKGILDALNINQQ